MIVGHMGSGPLVTASVRRTALSYSTLALAGQLDFTTGVPLEGVTVESDRASLVHAVDVLVLHPARSREIPDTMFGPSGWTKALKPGAIVIDQNIASPTETRATATRLEREHGAVLIDAPILGSPEDILAGSALILCGGPIGVYEKVKSILQSISGRTMYCGETGNGQAAKLVNTALALCNRLITYECASLAVKYGLGLGVVSDVINKSGGWNFASEALLPVLRTGGISTDQPLEQSMRDLKLAIECAHSFGTPMFTTDSVRTLLELSFNKSGRGSTLDEVAHLFEEMAAIKFEGA
jgi:3-hydroxyisobutyrate dehydrogenase